MPFKKEDGEWWYYWRKKGRMTRVRAHELVCQCCQKVFLKSPFHTRRKYCSRECAGKAAMDSPKSRIGKRGSKAIRWNGGRANRKGYIEVFCPDHPSLEGTTRQYVRRARLVMEDKLGRLLEPWEQVHHINGIKDDDRPDNLELWQVSHPAGVRVTGIHCPTCICQCHEEDDGHA
jgi:hypothetical protein